MPWGGWPDPRRDEDDWFETYTDGNIERRSSPRTEAIDAHIRPHNESSVGLEGKLRLRVGQRRTMDNEKESDKGVPRA
jgi:hypothetical protein